MTKAPIAVQELRRRIYRKAKSEKAHRFWGIFVHVTRTETLEEAYRIAKRNGGAAGIDGQTFATIETAGLECFLADIKNDLETGRYKPHPNRRVDIPKEQGKFRTLQIPCIRDRVVQGALKLILEAIFEADFCPNSYGFRPKRSPHRALAEVRRSLMRRMTTVIDVDLAKYFDNVRHDVLLGKIARRVQDPKVLHLVKLILKVGGKKGVPQGGPFSPLAANIYLNEADWYFDDLRRKTAQGPYEAINYHRFADDTVITVTGGAFPRKGGGENRTVTAGRRPWWPRMAGLQPLSTRAFGPRLRRLTALTALATRPLIATKRSTARCGQSRLQMSCRKISLRHLYAAPDRRSQSPSAGMGASGAGPNGPCNACKSNWNPWGSSSTARRPKWSTR